MCPFSHLLLVPYSHTHNCCSVVKEKISSENPGSTLVDLPYMGPLAPQSWFRVPSPHTQEHTMACIASFLTNSLSTHAGLHAATFLMNCSSVSYANMLTTTTNYFFVDSNSYAKARVQLRWNWRGHLETSCFLPCRGCPILEVKVY